jgi:hypothetical protein
LALGTSPLTPAVIQAEDRSSWSNNLMILCWAQYIFLESYSYAGHPSLPNELLCAASMRRIKILTMSMRRNSSSHRGSGAESNLSERSMHRAKFLPVISFMEVNSRPLPNVLVEFLSVFTCRLELPSVQSPTTLTG